MVIPAGYPEMNLFQVDIRKDRLVPFANLQVELAVLGAADEGVPFGRREEQHVAVRLPGIADRDVTPVEQRDLDGGGPRPGGVGTAAPHGIGQVSLELFRHAHSLPRLRAGRKEVTLQSRSSLPCGPTTSACSSSSQTPSLAR